jgi:hypothetical protein
VTHALASTGLITHTGDRFENSALANEFLVRGRPRYMGGSHELYADIFAAMLSTAESVRTGTPAALHDWEHMPEEQVRALLRGLNPGAAASGGSTSTFRRPPKVGWRHRVEHRFVGDITRGAIADGLWVR